MNRYLRNLEKIEFALTYRCTGNCKHCSVGEKHDFTKIDPSLAAAAVTQIAEEYNIKTVMVFGGEPLLHPDAMEVIMRAAAEMDIERRQIITNGFFSRDENEIAKMAHRIAVSGANDVLVSLDAFHQETIPIDAVIPFIRKLKEYGVAMRLQPAWLVSKSNKNLYNLRTREILSSLSYLEIPESDGNVVFPEGNAKKYLSEYFIGNSPQNPYTEDPCDVKCLSFSPNGDLLNSNVYENDVMDIIKNYTP